MSDYEHIAAIALARAEKAEARVRELEADSERFAWMAQQIEDTQLGDVDPCEYLTEQCDWVQAWRDAIDAALDATAPGQTVLGAPTLEGVERAIRAAIAEEREACAQVCEAEEEARSWQPGEYTLKTAAAAIRARGTK